MKFKPQEKQFQLIENITFHHLVLGVVIARKFMLPGCELSGNCTWYTHKIR